MNEGVRQAEPGLSHKLFFQLIASGISPKARSKTNTVSTSGGASAFLFPSPLRSKNAHALASTMPSIF